MDGSSLGAAPRDSFNDNMKSLGQSLNDITDRRKGAAHKHPGCNPVHQGCNPVHSGCNPVQSDVSGNSTCTGVADRSLFSGAGRGRGRGVALAANPSGDVGRGRGRGFGLAFTPELKRESEATKRKLASDPVPGGKAR